LPRARLRASLKRDTLHDEAAVESELNVWSAGGRAALQRRVKAGWLIWTLALVEILEGTYEFASPKHI